MNEDKRTWAEINLGNLEHNYKQIRARVPGAKFAGVVKANAYGHGAKEVAARLEKLGADCLCVSCLDEAVELRFDDVDLPMLILAPTPAKFAKDLVHMRLTQAVGDIETARAVNQCLGYDAEPLHVHIKLETGMGRTGFNVMYRKTMDELREIATMPNLQIDGVFTHFAVSDEPQEEKYTRMQYSRFTAACGLIEQNIGRSFGIRHCANSGAVVNYPETACDMVRPGILLYGGYPAGAADGMDLRPVMTLKSRIYSITEHKTGDSISYGRTFVCPRDMRLAVIPVGYADGIFRSLSNRMEVLVRGRRVKQTGRVCMDMCMVDVTDVPDVHVGDEVTLFGEGLPVWEQAENAETISYELLCAVSQRVPRIYVG